MIRNVDNERMTNQLNEFKSHYKDLKELKHYLNKNLIDDINRNLLNQGFSDYDEITERCKDYLIDEGSLFRFYKVRNLVVISILFDY